MSTQNKYFSLALLVVPREFREVFRLCHDVPAAGHQGIDRTKARLKNLFCWYGMWKDAESHVSTCGPCSRNKHPQSHVRAEMLKYKPCGYSHGEGAPRFFGTLAPYSTLPWVGPGHGRPAHQVGGIHPLALPDGLGYCHGSSQRVLLSLRVPFPNFHGPWEEFRAQSFPAGCMRAAPGSQGTHHSVSAVGKEGQPHPNWRGAVLCRQGTEMLGWAPGTDCRIHGQEAYAGVGGQYSGRRTSLPCPQTWGRGRGGLRGGPWTDGADHPSDS